MGLIHLLNYCLVRFRWHHHRRLGLVLLLRLLIDGEVVIDFVFLLQKELLKMLVVFGPQRNHHPRLPLLLLLLLLDTVVLFLLDPNHLESAGVRVRVFFLFLGDKDDFGQILKGIGHNLIHKLIIEPNSSAFDGLVGFLASLRGQLPSNGCKLVEVRSDDLV